MIHDAMVEVTCDGKDCRDSIDIELHAGGRNTYFAADSVIERDLACEGWIIEEGKHYCCGDCVPGNKRRKSR